MSKFALTSFYPSDKYLCEFIVITIANTHKISHAIACHLRAFFINAIIANNAKMSKYLVNKYANEEQKDPVTLDKKQIEKLGVTLIEDKIYKIENNTLRHDALKTAYLIFSYLMDGK